MHTEITDTDLIAIVANRIHNGVSEIDFRMAFEVAGFLVESGVINNHFLYPGYDDEKNQHGHDQDNLQGRGGRAGGETDSIPG